MRRAYLMTIALPVLLAGCAKTAEPDNGAAPDAPVPAAANAGNAADMSNAATSAPLPTDAWVGRWTGPEGLFLDIRAAADAKPGHYAITNRDNLDREAEYQGIADGATIRFVRDGKDLALRPGSGDETGFKYLAGKADCLIVEAGKEGYCR